MKQEPNTVALAFVVAFIMGFAAGLILAFAMFRQPLPRAVPPVVSDGTGEHVTTKTLRR